MTSKTLLVNRAPVLTLWAQVVAERLGYERDAALTLGKAVAGLTAQTKGRNLGIYHARPSGGGKKHGLGEEFWIELCGRRVPAKRTEQGVRAVVKDQPIDPEKVQIYLEGKFGEELQPVYRAMTRLAGSFTPEALGEESFSLYERFRPRIPPGQKGWGAKGKLDLDLIRSLAGKSA